MRLALISLSGLGACLTHMVDACSQLSQLRNTVDSIVTGLEVDTANFARITNNMVHLHKEEYVLACFKDKEAAQAVITRVVEFLQSRGLEVGSKLVGSDLFIASTSPLAQGVVADASRDLQKKKSTPPPVASTSASGAPVVNDGELDGEGEIEEEQSGAPLSAWLLLFCVVQPLVTAFYDLVSRPASHNCS